MPSGVGVQIPLCAPFQDFLENLHLVKNQKQIIKKTYKIKNMLKLGYVKSYVSQIAQ